MLQEGSSVARLERLMHFDEGAFFRALEDRRSLEGLSWRELGRRLELSPSTFSRLSRGKRPDVETFLKLLGWLGMPATAFLAGASASEPASDEPLAVIAQALRRDPRLHPSDVGPLEDILRVAYTRFSRRDR